MNMKKRALAFVICLFLLVALCIIYIFSELYTESDVPEIKNTDAVTFKTEYESINNKEANEEHTFRTLDIPDDNPFVYITAEELVTKIDKKETFVVYFGFNTCPWCRSILTSLIASAKKNNIDKIYYVDVKNIRDSYTLNDNHEPVRTVEGTKGYYDLLNRLDNVLEDYNNLTYTVKKRKKTVIKEVEVKEKRIYAPNVIAVKNGSAVLRKTGVPEKLTDPYDEITEEMNDASIKEFDSVFDSLKEENSCSIDGKNC